MATAKVNIETILNLPGNRFCADCGDPLDQDTGWASLNLGVVMCIQCAGIHRAMGTHITKIRSFRLDTNAWTDKITEIFKTIGGNERANRAVWETNLPSFWINPKWDKSKQVRKEFITSKYQKQAFLPPDQLRGRVNHCIKKMPIDVRQIECDFMSRGDKKYKTKEFAVIHSRWLSRYTAGKKSKATQQLDLTNFILKVELNEYEEYDGFEFSLYEDVEYIKHQQENRPQGDMYQGSQDDEKESAIPGDDEDEPLLRCRIKEFKQFVNMVKDIRSTIAYYRVLDTQFEICPDEPSLDITLELIQQSSSKMLGWAKMGGFAKHKRYFCTINGFVYQFKEDISTVTDTAHIPKALSAWDLQLIDVVLDENGKRSGSKYAVLIINGDKTISLKFNSGPEAVMFYAALKQQWTAMRGLYYVDFGVDPPIWSGEANGPQPIMPGVDPQSPSFSPSLSKKKSSVYLPKDGVANGIISSEDQDVVILQYIDEYEKRKRREDKLAKGPGAPDSDSSSEFDSESNMEFEDSDRFENSEDSQDPLYRQMTRSEQKASLVQNQFQSVAAYSNPNAGIPENRSSVTLGPKKEDLNSLKTTSKVHSVDSSITSGPKKEILTPKNRARAHTANNSVSSGQKKENVNPTKRARARSVSCSVTSGPKKKNSNPKKTTRVRHSYAPGAIPSTQMQINYGPGSGSNSSNYTSTTTTTTSNSVPSNEPGAQYLTANQGNSGSENEDSASCQTEFAQSKDPGLSVFEAGSVSVTAALHIESEMAFEHLKPPSTMNLNKVQQQREEKDESENGSGNDGDTDDDDDDDAMVILESISPGGPDPNEMGSGYSNFPPPPQRIGKRQVTSPEREGSPPRDDLDNETDEKVQQITKETSRGHSSQELLAQMKVLADQSSPGIDDEQNGNSNSDPDTGFHTVTTRGGPTPPPPQPPTNPSFPDTETLDPNEEEVVPPPPQPPQPKPSNSSGSIKSLKTHDPPPPDPPSMPIIKQNSTEKRAMMDSVSANINVSALLTQSESKDFEHLKDSKDSNESKEEESSPSIPRPEKKGNTVAVLAAKAKEQYAVYHQHKTSQNAPKNGDAFTDYQNYKSWRLQNGDSGHPLTYKEFTTARNSYDNDAVKDDVINHRKKKKIVPLHPPKPQSVQSVSCTNTNVETQSSVGNPSSSFSKPLPPHLRGTSSRRKSRGKPGKAAQRHKPVDPIESASNDPNASSTATSKKKAVQKIKDSNPSTSEVTEPVIKRESRSPTKRRMSNGIALRIEKMKNAASPNNHNTNESNGTATAALKQGDSDRLSRKDVSKSGKRRKMKKRKSSRRNKNSTNDKTQMNYLQLIRYFGLQKTQVAKCHNPAFVGQMEKELSRLAIVNVNKERKYIKVQISRRIPLPQRQTHWTSTMEAIQKKIGGDSLVASEMKAPS